MAEREAAEVGKQLENVQKRMRMEQNEQQQTRKSEKKSERER